VTGTIARTVGQIQDLLGFSQGNDQRMIAPLTFVVETDTLFLFTGGFSKTTVGFNRGLVEKRFWLLLPDSLANLVDRLHDVENLRLIEAATEVTGSGGVGNSSHAQSIEISFVGSTIFQVFQTSSTGHQIQRDVEYVIGFIIGHVKLEDGSRPIQIRSQI